MERCPSGLRSTLGKRVCAERCTAGSNPALSAIHEAKEQGAITNPKEK
jgi:hypothetical protein